VGCIDGNGNGTLDGPPSTTTMDHSRDPCRLSYFDATRCTFSGAVRRRQATFWCGAEVQDVGRSPAIPMSDE